MYVYVYTGSGAAGAECALYRVRGTAGQNLIHAGPFLRVFFGSWFLRLLWNILPYSCTIHLNPLSKRFECDSFLDTRNSAPRTLDSVARGGVVRRVFCLSNCWRVFMKDTR